MLEDVPGLINPIIQAMIQTSRQQGETADRAQRAQQMQDELKYRKAQLAQEEHKTDILKQQHEDNMDINRKYYDIYSQHAQAELEKQGLDRLAQTLSINKQKADLRQNQGVDLNQTLPMGAGRVEGGPVDQNAGIPSEQEHNQSIFNFLQGQSKATAQGTGEGQLAAALSSPGRQLANLQQKAEDDKAERDYENNRALAILHGGQSDTLETNRLAGEKSLANIRGGYGLAEAKIRANGGGDDDVNKGQQLFENAAMGLADPDKYSKNDKQTAQNYAISIGKVLPQGQVWKDYKKTLDNASSVQEIIQQAREVANKYSVDSPGSGEAGNKNIRFGSYGAYSPQPGTDANGLAPGSEAKKAIDGLATTVGRFIPVTEASNRQSDQNIGRQLTGLADPKAKTVDNINNINKKVAIINQSIKDGTAGVDPDLVNMALRKRGIVDFGGQNTPAAYSRMGTAPNGKRVGSNDGGKTTFEVSTGKAVDQMGNYLPQ